MGATGNGFRRGRAAAWAGAAAFLVASAGVIAIPPRAGAATSCGGSCFVAPGGSDSNSGLADSPLLTIQAGIDATSAGGVVHVAAGTYDESLLIDHPLTLQGANAGVSGTGERGPESLVELGAGEHGDVFNLTAPGLVTIDGFRAQDSDALTQGRLLNTSTLGNQLVFANNVVDESTYVGELLTVGSATATFSNNLFTNDAQTEQFDGLIAVWGNGGAQTNINFSGNTFSHLTGPKGVPVLELINAKGTISGNTFTDVQQSAITFFFGKDGPLTVGNNLFDQIESSPAVTTGPRGAGVHLVNSATIVGAVSVTGNTFTRSLQPILVDGEETQPTDLTNGLFTVTRNAFVANLAGHAAVGVDDATVGDLNATCNWWGQATGPTIQQFRGGVIKTPYLKSADLTAACPSVPPPNKTQPGAPTHVSGVPGSGSVKVSWIAPVNSGSLPIERYQVMPYKGRVAQTGAATFTTSPVTHVTVYHLTKKTSYSFKVVAIDTGGFLGALSAPSGLITVGAPGRPGKVKAVRGAVPGRLKVTFSAPINNGAKVTSFTAICTSTNGGMTAQAAATKNPIAIKGATVGKTYTCVVLAKNSRGVGPRSLPSANVVA
jgi:hypothetical protein